jgi:hypothetical protein
MGGVPSSDRSDRIQWLLRGPVLRTLAGTRCRLAVLSWSDLQLLCRHFGTDISGLEAYMWTGRRRPAKESQEGGTIANLGS